MGTRGIDFAQLSLMDALDLAVLIEEEARDRYGELAEQLEVHHTPEAADFFRKMVVVEERHRAALDARRAGQFAAAPRKVTRAMLFDIEAPEYDEARANMTPRAALQAAMTSEVKAYSFFAAAVPRVKDAEVKKLFQELMEEEVAHQAWVKAELEKHPATPADAQDVSDEPVAH